MNIPPTYTITNKIVTLLTKIEANKTYLQTITIPDKIISNLTHISLLKSSVYSAQIEGNSLSPEDIEQNNTDNEKQYERQEIENIISALTFLRESKLPTVIDIPFIEQLHRLVMHKLVHGSQAGVLRKDPSAIFDSHGNVVYMTPPPSEIHDLLIKLLHFINDDQDTFPLIKASLAHLLFEKIHPFIDGNGRVGRLLFHVILAKSDYHFNWLLSIEELIQHRKHTYYTLLEENNATACITFFLEVLSEESERLRNQMTHASSHSKEDFLFPRRREILEIIKDHTTVSFDQIQRRFLKIPARTLRYDIKQLEKEGLIQKIGTTRGALYQISKEN